ncbi:MAG: asparaginase [Flavobacteriales bacterium]|nr:asparaginase [Flavobacteriales bacterium]NCA19984.1 asparaginase [Crocinitomicaceae bacterium]
MKLLIHGGFFSEFSQSNETKVAKQNAMERIAKASFEYLKTHSAVETVVFAVEQLENDSLFNAGIGSQIQNDGVIRMSASLMDGTTKKFSGVINIQEVKNPIRVAENLITVDDRVLGGEGANAYAKSISIETFSTEIPERRAEYEAKLAASRLGTVGCVALDNEGKLAAATSTGGKGFEIPGRISDSATVAGNFANDDCAVSCTGVGEDIVSAAVASSIATRVTDGFTIDKAFDKTFSELAKFDGFAGAIGLDKYGNMFWQESHPKIVFAAYDGVNFTVFS